MEQTMNTVVEEVLNSWQFVDLAIFYIEKSLRKSIFGNILFVVLTFSVAVV
ncbi:hypothetical protein GCM10028806_24550 [Spirosoma terrae]